MTKKIFLTSMLAVCIACPAFAEDDSIDDGDMCTYSELNTYDGTANIEAIWQANTYSEPAGQYLLFSNGTISQHQTCPANYYCEGFTDEEFADASMGLVSCSEETGGDYPYSAAGTKTSGMCYNTTTITCSTFNPLTVSHGTVTYANATTSGKIYASDDQVVADTFLACSATVACDNGYTATEKGALADYVATSAYWSKDNIRFKSKSANGFTWGTNANALTAGQWEVTFGDGTKVLGTSSCNATAGAQTGATQPNGTFNGSEEGLYCWCNMGSYTLPSQNAISTASGSSWVFEFGFVNATACANNCANYCAADFASISGFRGALFGALGAYPTCNANSITLNWYNDNTTITPTNDGANSCTYDQAIVLPENEPSKTGYTFGGWRFRSSTPANNNNQQ